MANPVIAPGRLKIAYVVGKDSSGSTRALGSLTATIDNYDAAYVAKFPDAISFAVKPKTTPTAGTTVTVTVTLTGTDAAGGALPVVTQSFDIVGPPADPLATVIDISSFTDLAASSAPADPGSPTATLI